MNEEKMKQEAFSSRVRQDKQQRETEPMVDRRDLTVTQARMADAIQRSEDEEDELLQGKFETAQKTEENRTGIPEGVKLKMEDSFGADFSSVRVHPDSSKAPDVGALAYTQGADIHFAPGQFKPDTSAGQQLLGHELAHVIQQAEGRVQPTTEIGGMAVNDDVSLEHEADVLGTQAAAL